MIMIQSDGRYKAYRVRVIGTTHLLPVQAHFLCVSTEHNFLGHTWPWQVTCPLDSHQVMWLPGDDRPAKFNVTWHDSSLDMDHMPGHTR